jgi:hypothetical protein
MGEAVYIFQNAVSMDLHCLITTFLNRADYTPWHYSASELYRSSDRRFSTKLVTTFADKGCSVVSATDPQGRLS